MRFSFTFSQDTVHVMNYDLRELEHLSGIYPLEHISGIYPLEHISGIYILEHISGIYTLVNMK